MESAIGQLSREDFGLWAAKHAWEVSFLKRPHPGLVEDRNLGIDFLQMYLAHEANETVLGAVSRLIAASSDFEHLRLGVEQELQLKATRRGRRSTAAEISADAREYLQLVRATVGIHFQGRLQPILGAVGAVDVPAPATIRKFDKTLFSDVVDYEIGVALMNTYSFADLSCCEDDGFRERLLSLLADRRYFDCRCEYLWATLPHTNRLADSFVFAAFMHALEKNGFSRGPFAWHVAVPLRGRLIAPSTVVACELTGSHCNCPKRESQSSAILSAEAHSPFETKAAIGRTNDSGEKKGVERRLTLFHQEFHDGYVSWSAPPGSPPGCGGGATG